MTEKPKLENMGSEYMSLNCQPAEFEDQKISVSDHVNGLRYTSNLKSDSLVVDMERFSHLLEKDMNPSSRITLQRNLSRKGSLRGGEKKVNSSASHEKDTNMLNTSPRAPLHGSSMPEKPAMVTVGPTDHAMSPQAHHQITIMSGSIGGSVAADSKIGGKRFSFRRSSSWTIDPRRILLFFATLSSIGTILLIYFTLSMTKLSTDESDLN